MRHLPVVLALAFAGIHCGPAATDVGETTSDSEVVAAQEKRPHTALPERDESDGSSSGTARTPSEPLVTSSATDASGATYTAGTFTGNPVIGGVRMKSRGDVDVFVVKTSADGTPVWARAIGSRSRESAPRVSVDADTGRVTVIGMTTGEMDCGDGPLATFDETFFLCTFYGRDGRSLESAAFPTGRQ